jgi:hypothetical protein
MTAAMLSGALYLGSLGTYLPIFMRTSGIWAVAAGCMLSAGALHFYYGRRWGFSGSALAVSLLCMVYARHQLRRVRLRAPWDPAAWRITPQWLPLALFLACLAIALALIYHMLRLFFREQSIEDPPPPEVRR